MEDARGPKGGVLERAKQMLDEDMDDAAPRHFWAPISQSEALGETYQLARINFDGSWVLFGSLALILAAFEFLGNGRGLRFVDEVKHMNQMMLYSKIVTIRDAQIQEKSLGLAI